jgi:hypothetical protein
VTLTWNIVTLLCVLAYIMGYRTARWRYLRETVAPPSPDSVSDADIMAAHRAGRRIDALRLYRTRYQCGLKEAQAGLQALAKVTGEA